MGHGEAVEDSFLSLVDAMAHGKNKIVYFSGLFWDWFAGKGKEGMLAFFFFFLVGNVIFFYSKMFSTLFAFHLKLADSATVYLKSVSMY